MESPTTAAEVVRILPTTKDECVRFASQIIQEVESGTVNPLEMHVMLKAFEKASELITDAIKSHVMRETDKYSEKSFEAFGTRIDKAEVATKYNYPSSGDIIWEQRKAILDSATNQLKEREEFLRTLRDPLTAVNEETGEVYQIRPPIKTSTSGLKVFLK